MRSNSADSSLARSVNNTVVAVLLTVALALLFFMVVGLLVFSLVEFMGSAQWFSWLCWSSDQM